MSRTRRDNSGSIVDSLLVMPWWFSVVLAAVAMPGMYFVGALMIAAGGSLSPVGRVAQVCAIPAAVGLLLVAGGAALHARRKRGLADRALTQEGRAQLSAKEFEFAVAELLKSRGYQTEENLSCGADGGVDVRAWRDSKTYLVQCKHWQRRPVGRPDVQRLLGAVTSERATGGLLICSGRFTPDAREFARGTSIELIDGEQLNSFAAPQRRSPMPERGRAVVNSSTSAPPACPLCRSPMIMREAKKGQHAGQSFWGCSRYPSCRGIVNR